MGLPVLCSGCSSATANGLRLMPLEPEVWPLVCKLQAHRSFCAAAQRRQRRWAGADTGRLGVSVWQGEPAEQMRNVSVDSRMS
jgi:hypothetical protein